MFFRKKTPVVFIHGILGSMGEGILKGTGELDFGISEMVYRPIIDILEDFGYREGKNLFICYYDWTKKNMDSATNYLIPTIEKAKQISKSPKIDIVSHSMGGIVARAYAQSEDYKDDINKLIMIGTPNAGSANAYFFWSGGELVSKNTYKNVLYTLIKSVFMWYVKFKYKKSVDMEFIRDKIPSVKELLPTDEYGNYLISKEENQDIDINKMSIKNNFVNSLNSNKDILRKRNIKTYMIVGKDVDTIDKIKVISQDEKIEKWRDGKPVGVLKTCMGDGTVTCSSMEIVDGKTIYIDSDHAKILSNCRKELGAVLNIRRGILIKKEERFKIIYVIIGKHIKIEIDEEKTRNCESCNIITKKMSDDVGWTMIKATDEGDIDIKINATQDGGKVVIKKANISTGIIEEKVINISNKISLKI